MFLKEFSFSIINSLSIVAFYLKVLIKGFLIKGFLIKGFLIKIKHVVVIVFHLMA